MVDEIERRAIALALYGSLVGDEKFLTIAQVQDMTPRASQTLLAIERERAEAAKAVALIRADADKVAAHEKTEAAKAQADATKVQAASAEAVAVLPAKEKTKRAREALIAMLVGTGGVLWAASQFADIRTLSYWALGALWIKVIGPEILRIFKGGD